MDCPTHGGEHGYGCLVAGDDALVTDSVTGDVTVVSVTDGTLEPCWAYLASTTARRILLRAEDSREWTAVVAMTGMPSTIVEPSDSLQLSWEYVADEQFMVTYDRTLTLERMGGLVLFTTERQHFGGVPLPDLTTYGLTLSTSETSCIYPSGFACLAARQLIHVTDGTASVDLTLGTFSSIGMFSLVGAYSIQVSSGGCDLKSGLTLAAYATP